MVAAILVLVLGVVVAVIGLHALATGRYTIGSPGRPVWNLLTILRFSSVEAHPAVARLVGAVMLALGALAIWQSVLALLG